MLVTRNNFSSRDSVYVLLNCSVASSGNAGNGRIDFPITVTRRTAMKTRRIIWGVMFGVMSIVGLGLSAGAALAAGPTASNVVCTGCVDSTDIAAGAVTNTKIGADAVTGDKVLDGSLTGADIQDGSIGIADVGFNYAGSASKGGLPPISPAKGVWILRKSRMGPL